MIGQPRLASPGLSQRSRAMVLTKRKRQAAARCILVASVVLAMPFAAVHLSFASHPAPSHEYEADDEDVIHLTSLGRRVEGVRQALNHPGRPESMEAILALGRDSRYYVMVRGWLQLQLEADLSIARASSPPPRKITERIEFLKQAIRLIDLE